MFIAFANFGNENISQTLTASSLKLCQLIEDNELINWPKFNKKNYNMKYHVILGRFSGSLMFHSV